MENDLVFNRDCLEGMRELAENSVDAIVCDPPYGLSFMGANWDHGVPGVLYWQEALRVAKPGAHLLAFGGPRTHHRLMVAIEDAGWEIRDCLMWIYGGGLPKGLDLGKAFSKRAPPKKTQEVMLCDGWNTTLKPAYEPIVLARKPLDGTVAETVLKWGCGGINIDGCRIGDDLICAHGGRSHGFGIYGMGKGFPEVEQGSNPHIGRWPANLIFDEAAADLLDQQTGTLKSGANPARRKSPKFQTCYGEFQGQEVCTPHRGANSGGASRFFYCAKASKKERSGSMHPTVKPLDLMRYLCRLVTPPGGLILDPFLGSGTTAVAAIHEGFRFVGFEIDETYCSDARRRIEEAQRETTMSRPPRSRPSEPPSTPTLADFGAGSQ